MATPSIILVDDEVSFVEVTAKRLENRRIQTLSAHSGRECLELLKTHRDTDVIVLDVKMPGMDGIDTLKAIKEISPLTEVILLTGNATIESGLKGIELGAYDYLMKPCQIETLEEKVRMAARKKQVHERKHGNLGSFMETANLKELMVPIAEYATVQEDANVFEAIDALEEAQKAFHPGRYRHRAVLVLDKNQRVVGKLSQHDIIQALEPQIKGSKAQQKSAHNRFGFSRNFTATVAEQYSRWDRPLQNLYKKSIEQKVGSFMHRPTPGEYVELSATINETIHRLIIGGHHSLLVTNGPDIVGIVRLTDVFELIHLRLKALHLAAKIVAQKGEADRP
jgi:CheY-like chemotaxis protein/predicted transcriptional regulator